MTEPLGVTVRDLAGGITTHPQADLLDVRDGHLYVSARLIVEPKPVTVAVYAPGLWASATRNTAQEQSPAGAAREELIRDAEARGVGALPRTTLSTVIAD